MQAATPTPDGREIRNVALLDLTGAQAGDALDGVTRISNVATILVPESLLPKLSSIPMDRVAATIPVADGRRARVMAGQIMLSGEALAGTRGDPDDEMLVVAGQLVVTSPVTQVRYRELVVLGQAVAPTGSETALGAALTRLSGKVVYYPYVEGATIRPVSSDTLSGEALANVSGQATDILLATGLLVVTSPIATMGFQQVVAIRHLVVPERTPAEFLGKMQSMTGRLATYTGTPRVFDGKDHFSAGFFELFDEPITLVLDGSFSFDQDVQPQLLRKTVAGVVLHGKIRAPRQLVPMLQVLCVARDGKIESFDEPE
ncbi:MAG TPA: hypothetical protein VGJ60_17385 [Chloroflexota bacterium]|jgi:hypothetical protein